MSPYDVAIIGYGPVGAVLANLLGKQGMRVLVLEQAAEPFDKPRAIGLDHESIRIFQSVGLADSFMKNTRTYPGGVYLGVDGLPIKRMDPSPHPYLLGWPPNVTFVQPELEALLRAGVARYARVDVRLSHRLTEFSERDDQISLVAEDIVQNKTVRFHARYLVACDGANGLVRSRLNIPLEDQSFDEWWVVVDMLQRRPTELPPTSTQYCWPSRPTTYVFGPGNLRRWEMKLLPHETPDEFRDPERVMRALAPYVDVEALELWRSAVYRFHALVASRWRRGRIFLAGDAAHQTPPFLGQGLGAGIRDVANLAWKLEMVNHGAHPSLLATYEAERKPHVTELIRLAKTFGLEIGELDMTRALLRDRIMRERLAESTGINVRQSYIPKLNSGLIDMDDTTGLAGALFPQPRVSCADGGEALLDDVCGPNFLFVTDGLEPQSWLDETPAIWSRFKLERLAITEEAGASLEPIRPLRESSSLLRDWMRKAGARAVLVRPDRYVFGAASTPACVERQFNFLDMQIDSYTEKSQ